MQFIRLFRIIWILQRYGLNQLLRQYHKMNLVAYIIEISLWWLPVKNKKLSLPIRTRLALEQLGPVFIKFGQLLSTRQDLLPQEFIVELSKLQNQVPPFSGILARQIVEKALQDSLENVFIDFSVEAVASASIAQVHKAILKHNNMQVAVKILRPNIKKIIMQDINVLHTCAWFVEKILSDGKRLKPQEVIEEFKRTILAELDLLQDAANAIELKRLHKNDSKIMIPQVFYEYCRSDVMVLEWMDGIPIADIVTLKQNNIDLEQLSHNGVAIFYTQVFEYGFFHADMHPGNILCSMDGKYIALDFGIVGSLSEEDKRYLAMNIFAFFNRDYKTVARTHIESGWAPRDTSVEALENAVRIVCEPIFNKPLSEISFGQVLIKLFQVSRAFNITVQPQLLLLQKTIINVEGMGRILNPQLDLWVTAKPILAKWMKQQMGWRGLIKNIKAELPYWSYTLPTLPRTKANSFISGDNLNQQNLLLHKLVNNYKRQNKWGLLIIFVLIIILWYK